jgi:CRP-like cAMP-binding protein
MECPLFSGVAEPVIRRLAEKAHVRRYGRGQLLFSEGDSGDSLFVLIEGSLKAVSSRADGGGLLLAVAGPREVVGELSVADGGARSASVFAITEATVLRVPRDAVMFAATESPELTRALLASIAALVRRLTGSATDLVYLDTPRRVAKMVLAGTTRDNAGAPHLTQTEMASAVGASRQSVNSALQDLQRRGWIVLRAGEIELRDAAALRRFVGG